MQFTRFALAAAAFIGSVNALILTSPTYAGITVGKAFNISYSGATGPVTLTLKNGPETNLNDVEVLQSGLPAPSGSYTWIPSSSLPADTYAIEIKDGSSTNYGARFQLLGATASASSSGSSSSAFSAATTTTSGSLTTSTGFSNSTASATTGGSKTTSKSSPSKTNTAASTSSTTSAPGGNSAAGLASPLAMVLLAFAAVLSLN